MTLNNIIKIKPKKYFILNLTNSQKEKDHLVFKIRDTEAAEIWCECLKKAIPTGFYYSDRFYNFPNHNRSNLSEMMDQLDSITNTINHYVKLNIPKVDRSDLQNSLNYLHLNFAHNHLVEKSITPENAKIWSDFNTLIHVIESILMGKNSFFDKLGIPPASIIFTFNNPYKVDIPNNIYKQFSNRKVFGSLYFNYSQVGRQFLEIFQSRDDVVSDEHIQPSRFLSADTFLWLGPTFGHEFQKTYQQMFNDWFTLRKERFNRLGFYLNDPKLSLGHIAVADLDNVVDHFDDILTMQVRMAKFDRIESVELIS